MLLSVAPASIFDCASSMAPSCAFIAVGGLICRPPTQTDMALFAVGVENKFVSAARLLMCELRGVGLHLLISTQFRGMVLCSLRVSATLAVIM